MFNYIFLYGLTGAEKAYNVVRYSKICQYNSYPIDNIKRNAKRMIEDYPVVEEVYAIDSTRMLYDYYRETIMNRSIESNIAFRSFLENEGLRII